MAETTGYSVGTDTNNLVATYCVETAWGVINTPADGKICRLNSEGFGKTKTRTRPSEITTAGQVSGAVTTGVSTKGDLKVSISAGSHFDLLAASLMNVAETAATITAITIAATGTGFTDSGNGFVTAGLVAGQWVRVTGFAGATVNGYYQLLTVAAGTVTTLPAPGATEAATPSVTIAGQRVKNSNSFYSVFFEKKLGTSLYLTYPGSFPTGGSISANSGGYFEGSLSFIGKDEVKGTATVFSGTVTAANSNNIIDTVGGFGAIYRGTSLLAGTITKVDVNWSQSAREQRGMGSSATQGIGKGLIEAKGSIEMYFANFSLYDEAVSETGSMFSFRGLDASGNGYIITGGNVKLLNPKIVAGGPGQDVMASFELEFNPTSTSSVFGGSTIQIDKV